jgi:hypothetical protein
MKTALISLLVVTAMISTGAALVEPLNSGARLSRKEANHLINTAHTPEEHLKLASYFRREAQKNRDKEAHDLQYAGIHCLHPPRVDMYRNVSTSDMYRHLATEARQLALADDRLGGAHEQMALQLSQGK